MTDALQQEKLKGYVRVPPDNWPAVKYNTHIRYFAGGEFKIGGFVKQNPYDVAPMGAPDKKRFVRLQNGFNDKAAGYRAWIVA